MTDYTKPHNFEEDGHEPGYCMCWLPKDNPLHTVSDINVTKNQTKEQTPDHSKPIQQEWKNSHDYKQAIYAANKLLDEPYADPDDDSRTVARQFLRMIERYDALAQAHQSGIEQGRVEERKQLIDDIMAEIDGHYDNPNLAGNLEDLLWVTYQEWEKQ